MRRAWNKARRRLGESGETLVETLVSIMIVSLVFAFLSEAIVVAARINDSVRNEDVAVDIEDAEGDGTLSVTVSDGHITTDSATVRKYVIRDEDGGERYAYYEYIEDADDGEGGADGE